MKQRVSLVCQSWRLRDTQRGRNTGDVSWPGMLTTVLFKIEVLLGILPCCIVATESICFSCQRLIDGVFFFLPGPSLDVLLEHATMLWWQCWNFLQCGLGGGGGGTRVICICIWLLCLPGAMISERIGSCYTRHQEFRGRFKNRTVVRSSLGGSWVLMHQICLGSLLL